MRRREKKPSAFKNILKALLVLFLATNWLYMAISLVVDIFDEETSYYNTDAYRVNQFDNYYYEKKYDELYKYMHLYDTYDEKYDVYWEVMDAYIDLQEYFKWQQVSEEDIADARKMEEMYYNRVLNACENCRFPQNQIYLSFGKALYILA